MTKKIFITLALFALSFMIAGCSAQASKAAMQIEPAKLTEQSSATSYASTESIEYDKEIPLAIQVFTSKNGISSCGVEYFNSPEEYQKRGYDDVYVIAARFSKSELR